MKPLAQSSVLAGARMDKMSRYEYENKLIEKATEFTCVIGIGRTRFTAQTQTLESAKDVGAKILNECKSREEYAGKHVMIYADSIYVGKILTDGSWEERRP